MKKLGKSKAPAALTITREDFYIGCALIGLLASQRDEPHQDWVADWAIKQGRLVAARAGLPSEGDE